MELLKKCFRNYIFSPCSTEILGLFRIFFFTILFGEILQIFLMKEFYFSFSDYIGFEKYLLPFWFVSVCAIILGTKGYYFFATLNYICVSFILGKANNPFEYHMDAAWIGVSFLATLIPLNKSYSIPYFKDKNREQAVPQIFYISLIFIAIALIYADSTFFKWDSELWQKNLGLWLPSSLPPIALTNLNFLLNYEPAVKLASFVTIIFETLFILLFWFKLFRPMLFFIGVLLHVGICVAFPIPFFGLGYCALYLLLLFSKTSAHLTQWNKFTIAKSYFLVFFLLISTLNQIYLVSKNPSLIDPFKISKSIFFPTIQPAMHQLFGFSNHPVFLTSHFKNYKRQMRVLLKTQNKTINLTNHQDGRPLFNFNVLGRQWAYWTFRSNRAFLQNEKTVVYKIENYAKYIIEKKNLCVNNCELIIEKRYFKFNITYEINRFQRLSQTPWSTVKRVAIKKF